MKQGNKKPRMSEEDKKKKFGDRYIPNFKPKGGGQRNKPTGDNIVDPPKDDGVKKNDWTFYAINEQIAKDLGSFPYNNLSGVPVNIKHSVGKDSVWNGQSVAVIDYINAQLSDAQNSDGIRQAANQLYQFIRHKNSGARNYEPADCMMLVLAMRDIYGEFAECKRIIGLARLFNFENRNLPQTMMTALGVDYQDLIANQANYRGQLNILASRINSIAIPKYFKAFERQDFIASNVFMDSSSMRGQFYIYRKAGDYLWEPTASETGTQLTFTAKTYALTPGATVKFSTRLDRLATMIAAVTTDTDANTIAGDILAAFRDSEIYQLGTIDENYICQPFMDEDALAQIENSFTLNAYYSNTQGGGINKTLLNLGSTANVTQQNGMLFWQPIVNVGAGVATTVVRNSVLFNSHKDDPDYRDNLEWTRLIVDAAVNLSGGISVLSCGLELPLGIRVYDNTKPDDVVEIYPNITTSGATISSALQQAFALAQFDWHPAQYFYIASANKTITLVDIKKYTWLDHTTINATHDSANAAAFYNEDLFKLAK